MSKNTRSSEPMNWMQAFGGWWFFLSVVPLLGTVIYMVIRDYYAIDNFWVYVLIGSGSIPGAILFLLERPYPFDAGAGSIRARFPIGLSLEDRKLLTYWKTSADINQLILKCAILLFLPIALIPLSKLIVSYEKADSLVNMVTFFDALGDFILYSIFSCFIYLFILSRHLLKRRNKIKKMSLDPWPEDRLYLPGPLMKYRSVETEEPSSVVTAFIYHNPHAPANWYDLLMFGSFLVAIALLMAGFDLRVIFNNGLTSILEHKLDLFRIVLAAILLQLSAFLWKRRKKNKKSLI